MRILYVVPNVPSAIRVRPYNFIKRLVAHHEIEVACIVSSEYEKSFLPALRDICKRVNTFEIPRTGGVRNCIMALPSMTPLRLAYFRSRALADHVRLSVRSGGVDIIHLEHAKVASGLNGCIDGNVPVVLDAVDSLSLFYERQAASATNPLARAFAITELKKTRRFESKGLQRYDEVLISSNVDAEHIARLSLGEVMPRVVSNGVDLRHFAFDESPRDPNLLVFAGKLDYFPNAQAAAYVAREVLPILWRAHPKVKLLIVGNRPPSLIRRLAVADRIEVRGYVENMRRCISSAAVALAPLLTKAGIQNKILEAMAVGTPVIATPLACQGLYVEPGKHLLTGETAEDLARGIANLLDNPTLGHEIAHLAREYVVRHHNWDRIVDALESVYDRVLDERSVLARSW